MISDAYGTTRDSVLTLSPLAITDTAKYKCFATYSNIGVLESSEKQVVAVCKFVCYLYLFSSCDLYLSNSIIYPKTLGCSQTFFANFGLTKLLR